MVCLAGRRSGRWSWQQQRMAMVMALCTAPRRRWQVRGLAASKQAQGRWEALGREPRPRVAVYDLTRGPARSYEEVTALQNRLVDARARNATSDGLIVVEHEAVYTLGRGATEEHVIFDKTAPGAPKLVRCERGGDVTYHGPGQLVAYPVLKLDDYRRDSHWYLRGLEEVVIRTCAGLGLEAERHAEHTGVWLGGRKIAAVGVALRRWVAYHGVALNVAPRMADFDRIVPCGLHDESVGSLAHALDQPELQLDDVKPLFLAEFADVFEADLGHLDAPWELLGDDNPAT